MKHIYETNMVLLTINQNLRKIGLGEEYSLYDDLKHVY